MFNLSRSVACPHCQGTNFWKGDPAPADTLTCRYCRSFITTYDEYIYEFVREEAARMLAQFMETDSKRDLALIKHALSQQSLPGYRKPSLRREATLEHEVEVENARRATKGQLMPRASHWYRYDENSLNS
ncbi:hypothetical protein MHM84_06370 [Halomonas sp. McH1-25]|uniref:hypothetical protein n=1 Tax=unclassified Halomonas TaxID=2609666 RepID=UPI001EF6D882|nr:MULTISPECIES: hypothetical protein [unclassified Halomonas]MCG7599405.1 hypothetical protein [Halomonas sp. McH1-25]MCP1344085.1 hypothetical protein [Halomonas sp. FL8]MCP1362332.1 hypothetical protein [Halomonas sp. BBD45]